MKVYIICKHEFANNLSDKWIGKGSFSFVCPGIFLTALVVPPQGWAFRVSSRAGKACFKNSHLFIKPDFIVGKSPQKKLKGYFTRL